MDGGYYIPRRRRRRQVGGSRFLDFFKKANNFLRQHKVISNVANALGNVVPYASQVGSVASKLGYGRMRRVGRPRVAKKKIRLVLGKGGALALSGMGLEGGRIRRTRPRRRRY